MEKRELVKMKSSFVRHSKSKPGLLLASSLSCFLFLWGMQTAGAQKPRTFTVHIEGRVVGRPQSHALMLGEDTKSIWIATPTEIPIRNGRFSWAVTDSVERMYKMAFAEEYQQGAYRGILFINEGDTLHATLYSDERAAENVIGGSPQNDSLYVRKHWVDEQFRDVRRKQDSLRHAGNYFSEAFETLEKRQDETTNDALKEQLTGEMQDMLDDGRAYSAEAVALERASRRIGSRIDAADKQAYLGTPNTYHYYLLKQDLSPFLSRKKPVPASLMAQFLRYEEALPCHPYTDYLRDKINANTRLLEHKPFVDFDLPALDGTTRRISDLIRGKVAVIDLWASWCGPCRRHSKELIPVYEEFKDKRFTIVGIAREMGQLDDLKAAVKKDRYPWTQLYELDDAHGVWQSYGVMGAGAVFLIGRDGHIVAQDPTTEEIRVYLEKEMF